MQHVSVHEAKTHLSRLLKQIAEGKEIIITSSGKPVAMLAGLAAPKKSKRKPGMFKGQIKISKNFDNPVSEEWLLGMADDPFTPPAPKKKR